LPGTQKDVRACKDAPDEVKKEVWEIVGLQQKLNKKSSLNMDDEMIKASEERNNNEEYFFVFLRI